MGRLKTTRVKAMDLDSKSKKTNNDKKGKIPKPPQKYKVFSASFSALLKGSQCAAWTTNQSMAGSQSSIVQSFALFTCHTQAAGTGLWTISRSSKTTMEQDQGLIYSLGLLYWVQNKNAVTAEWPYIYWLTRWRELLTYVSPEPPSPSDGCWGKSNKGLCIVFSAPA